MSIANYVASLLPSFDRSRIEEDIRLLTEELGNNTIVPYQNAADLFSRNGFQSKEVEAFNQTFGRQVRVDHELLGVFPKTIYLGLLRCLESVKMLEGKVDTVIGRDLAATGLSYKRANLLRFIEVANFTAKYARKLLLWTYANEKIARGHPVGDPLAPVEMDYLFRNRQAFFSGLSVVSKKTKTVEALIANIPNLIVVPEEAAAVEQTVGTARLDPLQTGIIPIVLNPIYHIRMAIAEYQVERYKAGQEERRALEYRLLALKDLLEGKEDAKLEQQIEYTENRLKKLNHKLAKMEEN
jgi:hypothetical protein